MWLIPCSRSSCRVVSASALEALPSAAAPKITRLDSCPVAPKGARSIMENRVMGGSALPRRGHIAGPCRLRWRGAQARRHHADAIALAERTPDAHGQAGIGERARGEPTARLRDRAH